MAKYRPNVAAILVRSDKRILVAERVDVENAWQFPQGGVDAGEDMIGALYREVGEELGLGSDLLHIKQCRTPYRYRFPGGHRKGSKGWIGQEQTYFLCDFTGTDEDIDLAAHDREFTRFRWMRPEKFKLKWLPEFKRKVYKQVFHDFFGVDLK